MRISDDDRPSIEVIRLMASPHCARGPKRCEKCQDALEKRDICLLQVFLDAGDIARPVLELDIDGSELFYEFDVIKTFSSKTDALDYAEQYNVEYIFLESGSV